MRSSASSSKTPASIPKRERRYVPLKIGAICFVLAMVVMLAFGSVLASVVHHQVVAGHARDQTTTLLKDEISTNRLHGCRLLDAVPVGRSPIIDAFRNSPYPVGIAPDGKFIYQPYCPSR